MRNFTVLVAFAFLALVVFTEPAAAQRRWYRGNVRDNIRNLEEDTDRFKSSLDDALDRSSLNGTREEDEINDYVKRFEEATDRLRDRAEDSQFAPGAAREVLNRGRAINAFMRTHRLGAQAERDWVRVRNDLNRLANAYYIRWRW